VLKPYSRICTFSFLAAGINSVGIISATTCLLLFCQIQARMFVTWFCISPEIFYVPNCVLNRAVMLTSRCKDISVYSGICLMLCLLFCLVQVLLFSEVFLVCLFRVSVQWFFSPVYAFICISIMWACIECIVSYCLMVKRALFGAIRLTSENTFNEVGMYVIESFWLIISHLAFTTRWIVSNQPYHMRKILVDLLYYVQIVFILFLSW